MTHSPNPASLFYRIWRLFVHTSPNTWTDTYFSRKRGRDWIGKSVPGRLRCAPVRGAVGCGPADASCGRATARELFKPRWEACSRGCVTKHKAGRTWQMSHMGLAVGANATRSCFATTGLAEWMLMREGGIKEVRGGWWGLVLVTVTRVTVGPHVASTWERQAPAFASQASPTPRRSRRTPWTKERQKSTHPKTRDAVSPIFQQTRVPRKHAPHVARPAYHRIVRAANQRRGVRRAHLAESLHGAVYRGLPSARREVHWMRECPCEKKGQPNEENAQVAASRFRESAAAEKS